MAGREGGLVADGGSRSWHQCDRWMSRGMACPFPGKEFDFDDDREDRSPKFPIFMVGRAKQTQTLTNYDVVGAAEEVVAAYADRVPIEARTLRQQLIESGATAATGAAAAWAIRQVVQSGTVRGFGGGFFFDARFDPQQVRRRKLSGAGGWSPPGGPTHI